MIARRWATSSPRAAAKRRGNANKSIQTRIRALPPNEGGRTHPLFTGYRPNVLFDGMTEFVGGDVEPSDGDAITPGTEGRAVVQIRAWEHVAARVGIGHRFGLFEGPTLVANGEVLAILD